MKFMDDFPINEMSYRTFQRADNTVVAIASGASRLGEHRMTGASIHIEPR